MPLGELNASRLFWMERIIWVPIAIVAAVIVGFAIGLNIGHMTRGTTTIIYHDQPAAKARDAGNLGP